MAGETFYAQTRALLDQMLNETPKAEREEVLDAYATALTQLHGAECHAMLNEVIRDAHMRLDARLSPDPVRQTLASVQSGMQDIWRSIWK